MNFTNPVGIVSQALLEPVAVEVAPGAAALLEGQIEALQRIGFTLEPFDAVGRFRETDHAKKVDATEPLGWLERSPELLRVRVVWRY